MNKLNRVKKQSSDHHMRLRGNSYFVQRAVPKNLINAYSKTVIEVTLNTDALIEARMKRDAFLAHSSNEFRRLKEHGDITPEGLAKVQSEMAQSFELVQALERIKNRHIPAAFTRLLNEPWRDMSDPNEHPIDYLFDDQVHVDANNAASFEGLVLNTVTREDVNLALHDAEKIARALFQKGHTPTAASPANSEPIDKYLDHYFETAILRAKQEEFCRRATAEFMGWLTARNVNPIVGNATKELSGDYAASLRRTGQRPRGPKAINNHISAISSYWRYLVKRDKATFNPFEGQSLSRRKVEEARIEKRPFFNEEMKKLLLEKAPHLVADCIRLLALHGMRNEELCQLRAGDCKEGVIRIYGGGETGKIPDWHKGRSNSGKSKAARRNIPIHSMASSIIERRLAGKRDVDYLIHELKTPKNPSAERSKPLGKMFAHYRKKIGVHEQELHQTQSKVDMHSLRRWFSFTVIEAKRDGAAGFDEWTIADVMGHDKESSLPLAMTMGTYPGPSSMERKKKCIEAVRLP